MTHLRNPRATLSVLCALALAACLAGCGEEEEEGLCQSGSSDGCPEGQICADVVGGEPACFLPVKITGRVIDAVTSAGIAGATVVALDANGSARTTVVRSGADGSYSLPVLMKRKADGSPSGDEKVTLRVAAAGYQHFARAPRSAVPLDLALAQAQADGWVVKSAATDVALVALASGAGASRIEGRLDPIAGGVLVVASQGGKAVSTAISDTLGAFVLFNVPAGGVDLAGYRAGVAVAVKTVTVADTPLTDVVLATSSAGLAVVSGQVGIVNATGGLTTSVLLVPEATFDATLVRGEAPAGLRAGGVSGAYSIKDVPPGSYVVLAAFENDNLVRDPDASIGGTAVAKVQVAGQPVTVSQSFKITGALDVVSPGAAAMETVSAGGLALKWKDDSSEDGYHVQIYDALGNLAHENKSVARVTGSDTVSYAPTGLTLKAGMIYQFRALSWRDKTGGRTYISATEDLKGVFMVK